MKLMTDSTIVAGFISDTKELNTGPILEKLLQIQDFTKVLNISLRKQPSYPSQLLSQAHDEVS